METKSKILKRLQPCLCHDYVRLLASFSVLTFSAQRELQEREQSSQPQRKPRDTQTQTQRETEEEQQEDNERAENALKLVPPSEHFWRAYDALTNSERGADLFVEGTKIAKDVQMEIVKQVWQERDILLTTKAKEVIQKQEVSKNSHFMSLLLSESSHPEYFSQPLILSQLAHFIVDTLIVCPSSHRESLLLFRRKEEKWESPNLS